MVIDDGENDAGNDSHCGVPPSKNRGRKYENHNTGQYNSTDFMFDDIV